MDLFGAALIAVLFFYSAVKNSSKVQKEETYLLADRQTSFFPLLATLVMTEFNTSTLIAFSSLGFLAGFWALNLPLVFLIGLAFYALTVAKKWQGLHASSVSQIFRERYGESTAKLASVSLLLAMVGFSASYVKSMIFIFQPLFVGISEWTLGFLLVFAVLLAVFRGGLLAIIRTDIVSFLLLLFFLPTLLFYAYSHSSGFEGLVQTSALEKGQQMLPSKFILSLILITMFTYILSPWYGQKIFAAKSKKVAFSAVSCASILVFLMYGMGVLSCALIATQVEITEAQKALPYLVDQYLPTGLRGVAYTLLFATGATTLSGLWSAMVTMILADFFPKKIESGLGRSMGLTVLIAILSLILGVTLVDNILNKLILANIPIFALSFALLAAFYWKGVTSLGAWVSICSGLLWGVFSYLYWGEEGMYTWYWSVYGLLIVFASGILVSSFKWIPLDLSFKASRSK